MYGATVRASAQRPQSGAGSKVGSHVGKRRSEPSLTLRVGVRRPRISVRLRCRAARRRTRVGSSPARSHEFGVPLVPGVFQFFDLVGILGRQVFALADVLGEVEQLGRRVASRPATASDARSRVVILRGGRRTGGRTRSGQGQLPIAFADGHLVAESPEENFVGCAASRRRSQTATS